MLSLSNGMAKYASLQSITENDVSLARLASEASILGRGQLSLTVTLLISLQSAHILILPFFFRTTTIGELHGDRDFLIIFFFSHVKSCWWTCFPSTGFKSLVFPLIGLPLVMMECSSDLLHLANQFSVMSNISQFLRAHPVLCSTFLRCRCSCFVLVSSFLSNIPFSRLL